MSSKEPNVPVFHRWEDLIGHFGGADELKESILEACGYDYPHVSFDDFGDGPVVVLEAADSPVSVAEVLTFPMREDEFWRIIGQLDDRLTEAVEVIDLPHIEHDGSEPFALVESLADQLQLEKRQIVNTIGGGWVSCDDLVDPPERGTLKWYSVGEPVLAVIGIGRQSTTISAATHQPAGFGGPERLELGASVEVVTIDLLGEFDDDGAVFLQDVIRTARKRLKLCQGCRTLQPWVSDRDGFRSLCAGCQSGFTGIIFD